MKVIVLTKSSKNQGFCVVGIDSGSNSFVRLVSNDDPRSNAIPQWCMEDVNVLDVIDVTAIRRVPLFCQQENVEVQLAHWKRIGSVSMNDLERKVNNTNPFIFENNCPYLDEECAQRLSYSLMMVRVSNLSLTRSEYGKTKANFCYNGIQYSSMSVTDPEFFEFGDQNSIDNAILVVSIPNIGHTSDRYSNRCYKFVSKIFIV